MTTSSLWNAIGDLTSSESVISETALHTLRSFGAEAVEPLGLTLRIGSAETRQAVVIALAHFASLASVTYLIEVLQDDEESVRSSAIGSLVALGGLAVDPLLQSLHKHSRYRTNEETAASLQEERMADQEIILPPLDQPADQSKLMHRALLMALSRIEDTRTFEPLVTALRDVDEPIRLMAADALARRGALSIPALLAALDDNLVFRQHVAECLIANEASIDDQALAMLMMASRVGRTPVRWVSDFVLSQLSSATTMHMLDHALSDPDEDVRLIAVQSIRAVTDNNIEPLLKAVSDVSALVRRAAVTVLADVTDPRARAALVRAANDEDLEVRHFALRMVGSMSDISELEPLINALSNRDTALRKTAAEVLSGMEADRVVPSLLSALKKDAYGDVSRTLGRIGDKRAVEPLLLTLETATYVSRQAALEALGSIADHRALPAFLKAMDDDTTGVREAAVRGLDKLTAPESIPRLIEALTDPAPTVREGASLALEHMGALVIQAMLPSLESPDWRIRLNTVQILGRIGDVRAVEVLLRKLHDPAGNVCGAVISELKRLMDPRCIGWLLRALEDRDSYVRENVADLLMQLGDSFTLPRLVVGESRLSERERAAILDYMRHIRYSDRHITFRFTAIGDVISYCRQIANDPDAGIQAGAKAILAYIQQLRATQTATAPASAAIPVA